MNPLTIRITWDNGSLISPFRTPPEIGEIIRIPFGRAEVVLRYWHRPYSLEDPCVFEIKVKRIHSEDDSL